MISTLANVVVNIISSIFAVIGNGSIFYVVLTKQRFHTPSNIVIAGLAFTDFVNGLVVQPLYVACLIALLFRSFPCELARTLYYFGYLCGASSFWTLLIVTLERWLAVIFPFKHAVLVSNRKCCYCLITIWIWTSTTTLFPSLEVIPYQIIQVSTTILYTILLIVVFLCYMMLYTVIKRKRKNDNVRPSDLSRGNVNSLEGQVNVILGDMANTALTPEQTSVVHNSDKAKNEQSQKTNFHFPEFSSRKENVIAFIILALLICYAPRAMQEDVWVPLTRNHCTSQFVMLSWLITLVYLNSSINFILYGYRDKQLLKAAPLFSSQLCSQS